MQEILNSVQINQKITRLAHQIIENTFEEDELFLGGIVGNGYILAQELHKIIKKHTSQKVQLFEISMNKENPWDYEITLDIPQKELKNKTIILIDDVLNSGKTMQYACIKLLQEPTKAIKTVALVDRKHRRYPIKADFVGLSLSTTLKERVEIEFSENIKTAYLV